MSRKLKPPFAPRPPRPPQLEGLEVIVGGVWDTRGKDDFRPEDGFATTAYNAKGKPFDAYQCCAVRKANQGGGRCTQKVKTDAHGEPWAWTCHYHGGKASPQLVGEPAKRRGRYLRGKTSEFAARLRRFVEANDLLDNAENIALIDSHIEELLTGDRLSENDVPGFRRESVRLFNVARQARSADELQAALAVLGRHLRTGWNRDRALLEVHSLSERRARIADAQRRRENEEAATFSQSVVVAALDKILLLVSKYVPRQQAEPLLDAITRELVGGATPLLPAATEPGTAPEDPAA